MNNKQLLFSFFKNLGRFFCISMRDCGRNNELIVITTELFKNNYSLDFFQ